MIKNKKVLLICKESFSFPLFFIAQKLLSEGNDVGAFFIYPEESYFNKCMYNENTFYKYKEELKDVKLYGLSDLCFKFNEVCHNQSVDMSYLSKIENEYSHFKNLNLQLTSSQLTTRHYHFRNYFKYSSFAQNLNFLELGYKKVIEVVEDFKPDLILDNDNAELLRTILNEVAFNKKIPYITVDHPRYELYKIPTYCLGVRNEDSFVEEYSKCLKLKPKDLSEEYEYIYEMRKNSNIMSQEYKGTITSNYSPNSLIYATKYLVGIVMYLYNVYLKNKNFKLLKKNSILYSNPIKLFTYFLKIELKSQYLFKKNKYFENPVKDEDYVYMPLHLIPESTTFVLSPFFINELNIIEQVSKSLPIGWKLYVKEHRAMVGERSLSFYEDVKKIPNVKLVHFNYYNDPKPWIENAKGVVTITGTAAYEAAMLGKNAIVFGDLPFSLLKGVTKVRSYDELPSLIASFAEIDNIHSCAAYIAAVKNLGVEVNLTYLIPEAEAILNSNKKYNKSYSEKFKNEVDKLYFFYEKSYAKYVENMYVENDSQLS
jgi:hypothetical protein